MGMYTEFFFAAELKPETDVEVIYALIFMTNPARVPDAWRPPDHPLFKTGRWDHMLKGGSAYSLYGEPTFRRGRYSKEWELHVHSNFKNYDDEIKRFLDWIAPHVSTLLPFIGYHRYEQSVTPTLLYITDGGKIIEQPIVAPEGVNG